MALLVLFRYGRADDGFVQESDMQAGRTQARLRIRESLDAHPELTIILDTTGSPS
jgi:hypothetical protein